MATKNTNSDATTATAAPVRVRITKNKTHAAGGFFAAGATLTLPMDKAKTLEALGCAVILGV